MLFARTDHTQKPDMVDKASIQHNEWLCIDNSYDANDDDVEYDSGCQGLIYALAVGLGEAESDRADTMSRLS